MKQSKQDGSSVIAVLVLALIISMLLAPAIRRTWRLCRELKMSRSEAKQVLESETGLTRELLAAKRRQPAFDPRLLVLAAVDERDSALSGRPHAAKDPRLLLSLLSPGLPAPARPDWTAIERAGAADICRSWHAAAHARRNIGVRSLRTCTEVRPITSRSIFIPGNLVLDKGLHISAVSGQTLRFAVKGELSIAGELVLSQAQNASIEVIAAGGITVRAIRGSAAGHSLLLLHSSTGDLRVTHLGNANTCQETSASAPHGLLFAAEAGNRLYLGNVMRPAGSGMFGCPVNKDSIIWPQFKAVARLVGGV